MQCPHRSSCISTCHHCFSIMPHSPMPISVLSLPRVPQAGVNSDWPSTVHFTFQLYRFPPVATERLKLLDPERNSKLKSSSDYPCVLSVINKDGSLSTGMIIILLRMLYDYLQHSSTCLFHLTNQLSCFRSILESKRIFIALLKIANITFFILMNSINVCKNLKPFLTVTHAAFYWIKL